MWGIGRHGPLYAGKFRKIRGNGRPGVRARKFCRSRANTSRAGRRVTAQIPNLDRRFSVGAAGNLMYRNEGDRFLKTSGLEPPAMTVAEADWSWGGQFVDIDNDTTLDLYVPSGFYTAPEEVAVEIDL